MHKICRTKIVEVLKLLKQQNSLIKMSLNRLAA